jgi:hypothetical protein
VCRSAPYLDMAKGMATAERASLVATNARSAFEPLSQ